MKTKLLKTERAAERALRPLIKYRVKNPGFVQMMAVRMTRRTGALVLRQQVEAWLHPDVRKRVEPKLGVGLLLMAEGTDALRKARK